MATSLEVDVWFATTDNALWLMLRFLWAQRWWWHTLQVTWSSSWYCLVVINSFCCMFLTLIQRLMSLYLTANLLWVFFVGPGPVRLVVLLLWRRNASLAGGFAGRPGLWFCGFVCWFAFLQVPANCAVYHLFHRLCRYQDRATEHLRPNSRKKKRGQQKAKTVNKKEHWPM